MRRRNISYYNPSYTTEIMRMNEENHYSLIISFSKDWFFNEKELNDINSQYNDSLYQLIRSDTISPFNEFK